MKKIFFLIVIFAFLVAGVWALFQEGWLLRAITPDSPFYFIDILSARASLLFAFDPVNKFEKALSIAEERVAEVKEMAEENKAEAANKANQGYQEFLDLANTKAQEAKEKGKDTEELEISITEKTLEHQEGLIEVFEKVPEEAKEAIEKAIEVSRKGSEQAVDSVTGAKKEELLQKIEEIRTKIEEKIKELEGKPPKEKFPKIEKKGEFIQVLSPNGGEIWVERETYDIAWQSQKINRVSIFLIGCLDQECKTITETKIPTAQSIDAKEGSYSWTIIPEDVLLNFSKYTCFKIKIGEPSRELSAEPLGFFRSLYTKLYAALSAAISKLFTVSKLVEDVSDECFTIVSTPPTPSITVLSPNGGEVFGIGETHTIKWQTSGIPANARIFIQLFYKHINIDPGYEMTIMPTDTANTGTYAWTIGNVYNIGDLQIDQFLIRVGYSDPTADEEKKVGVEDYSDAPFSILKPE